MKIYTVFRIFGFTLLGIIVFVGIYLLFAFLLSRISIDAEVNDKKDKTIFVMTNGVHSDIVMPIKSAEIDWSKEIKFENTVGKDTTFQWLGIGWGDKGFYLETPTWAELKPSVAINAAIGNNTTAMHATFYHTVVESDSTIKIEISNEQYLRLVNYIKKSFELDAQGHFINIKTNANYGKNDAFYEAIGRYSLFKSCNTWTNNGLKVAGQKAALWTPFDTGIFYQYKK